MLGGLPVDAIFFRFFFAAADGGGKTILVVLLLILLVLLLCSAVRYFLHAVQGHVHTSSVALSVYDAVVSVAVLLLFRALDDDATPRPGEVPGSRFAPGSRFVIAVDAATTTVPVAFVFVFVLLLLLRVDGNDAALSVYDDAVVSVADDDDADAALVLFV